MLAAVLYEANLQHQARILQEAIRTAGDGYVGTGSSSREALPFEVADSQAAAHVRNGLQLVQRHALDPGRQGVAIADVAPQGGQLVFCERHREAAKADLMRIGAEIREELEPESLTADLAAAWQPSDTDTGFHPARRMAGAIYVSCSGRGGPHFGGPSAELQILRRALGDVPLVGFFAGGEIAHHRLYGYTGVLTVFTTSD